MPEISKDNIHPENKNNESYIVSDPLIIYNKC